MTNFKRTGRQMETFEIEEYPIREFLERHTGPGPKVSIFAGLVERIDPRGHTVTLAGSDSVGAAVTIPYDRLCLATGARPRRVIDHPRVIGLRDADTVAELSAVLSTARCVGVVGNGGIALGLVAALATPRGDTAPAKVPVVWAVKDAYIGNTFFDASLSAFFLEGAAAGSRSGGGTLAVQRPDAGAGRLALGSLGAHVHDDEEDGMSAACCHGHVDAPLPSALPRDGEEEEDEGVELVPTYHPLPQRTRRRGKRHTEATNLQAANDSMTASGSSGGVGNSAMVDDGEGGGAGCCDRHRHSRHHHHDDDNELASPSKKRRLAQQTAAGRAHGAALGPAWTAALTQHPASSSGGGGGITLETGVSLHGIAAVPPLAAAEGTHAGPLMHCPGVSQARVWLPAAAPATQSSSHHSSQPLPPPPALVDVLAAAGDGGVAPDGSPWPLLIVLTNGAVYGVDALVSATGVAPALPPGLLPDVRSLPLEALQGAEASSAGEAALRALFAASPSSSNSNDAPFYTSAADGGLLVDPWMRATGHPDVFAAGDAAAVTWPRWVSIASNIPHPWFQMRTWGQARVAGAYAARCMLTAPPPTGSDGSADGAPGDMHYEMFTHVTSFLGYKVVLLGLFNGQGLGAGYEAAVKAALTGTVREGGSSSSSSSSGRAGAGDVCLQVRVTPGAEYIKLVLWRGRLVGAILVGDTDLDETIENLVLNGLAVPSAPDGLPVNLLDPEVDIEDFFD